MENHKTAEAASLMKETELVQVSIGSDMKLLHNPRPDLAGLRVKLPNDPAIYLILPEGYKHHIPDPTTYNNLFRDWNGIVVDISINEIPTGPALTTGAILSRGNGTAPVYLISNGVKRHVAAPATMDKYNFSWEKVYVVPSVLLDFIPTGNQIS